MSLWQEFHIREMFYLNKNGTEKAQRIIFHDLNPSIWANIIYIHRGDSHTCFTVRILKFLTNV